MQPKEPKSGAGGFFLKIWRVAKDFTTEMAREAFVKVIKKPLNWLFTRKYKTRGKEAERKARWWIEVKGDKKLKMLASQQNEIEKRCGCCIEVKSC